MPLDLNYHHLYYFWVCVRSGSLTAAARELHLSQSALSLQLKSLETSVGRRLLERSRSGVVPTVDGRVVFERCERIFPEGEALARVLRSRERKDAVPFRIGVASGLGREVVLAVLERLRAVKRLTPLVHMAPGADVLQRLQRRQVDAALFSGDYSSSLGGAFRCRRLDALPMKFVAAPSLASRLSPFPRRGREYPMILRPTEHPVRIQVESWMLERGIRALPVAETADADLMRALALQGRGIAVLPAEVVREDLAGGRLEKVPGSPGHLLHEIWGAAPVRLPAEEETREAVGVIMGMSPVFPAEGRPSSARR